VVILAGADQEPRLNARTGPVTARALDKAHIVSEVGVCPVQQREVVRETPVEHLFQTVDGLVILKVWRLWTPTMSNPVQVPIGVPSIDEWMARLVNFVQAG